MKGLERTPIKESISVEPVAEQEERFIQELQQGKYLGILETYLAGEERWSEEKVAQEIWQNFYDPNKTLDNVEFVVTREEHGESIISICDNDHSYDFRELLHLGAGAKTASRTTAGKYGEGTRICALHMLRDYGFRKEVE